MMSDLYYWEGTSSGYTTEMIDELLAACEFYADEGNYENDTLYINGKEIPNSSYCKIDGGDVARAAIAEAKGKDK